MAAHVLSVLQETKLLLEIITWEDRDFDKLLGDLENAPFGMSLEYDHYIELRKACEQRSQKRLLEAVNKYLPFYENIHASLKNPKTQEEWLERHQAVTQISRLKTFIK